MKSATARKRMIPRAVSLAFLLLLIAGPALSKERRESGTEAAPRPDAVPAAPPAVSKADVSLSPVMEEIGAAWEKSRLEVAGLEERFASASGEDEALAIQKEIERLLVEVELEILGIQARYAREEGRIEVAEEIEAAIESMTSPAPLPAPEERPAPAAERQ